MAAVFSFMESPLVVWVSSFYPGGAVDFVEISDGVFLNDVLTQIDERDIMPELNRSAKDVNGKLQNWEIFNSSIKLFYQEILQQVIVMDLPDILTIVNDPTKDSSLAELKKALLLVLGCAVQCDKKEFYINSIKQQDLDVQSAIVDSIKEITENTNNVLSSDAPSEREDDYKVMHNNIKNLVTKRDQNYQALVHVTQERNYWRSEVDKKSGPVSPPAFLEKHHLVRELNKQKELNSKLNEETEEKSKQLEVVRSDLQEKTEELNKVKSENFQLVKDARTARSYRDELDMYKEMASKADKYEKEILKYKESLNEMTFYKTRVEELRDDNTMLCESRATMETQLVTAQKKSDSLMKDLLRAQGQLDELNAEKVSDQKKIQALLEDLSALEFEKNNMKDGYSGPMRRMISYASSEFLHGSQLQLSLPASSGHSISEELSDSMASKARKMELENHELHLELDELRNKVSELERELNHSKQKLDLDYKQKLGKLETQAKESKILSQREMERIYKEKTLKLEEENKDLKERLTNSYNEKVQTIQRRNQDVEEKVKHIEEMWRKDKENSIKLEEKCKELIREKEQYREKYDNLAKNTESMENMIYKDREKAESLRKHNRELQRDKDVYKHKVESSARETEEQILQLQQEIDSLTLQNENLRCTCTKNHLNELENNNHLNSFHDQSGCKHQGVSCDLDSSIASDITDVMNTSYSSTVSAPAGYGAVKLRTSTPQKRENSSRNRTSAAPVAHIAGTPQNNNQYRHSSYQCSPADSDDLQKMWYAETVNRLAVNKPGTNKKSNYDSDSTLDGTSDTSSQSNEAQPPTSDMQMRQAHSLRRGVVAPIRRGLPLESDHMAQMRASMPAQKLTYVEPPELPEKRRSMSPRRASTLNRSESFRQQPTKKDKSLSRSETFHVSPEEKQKSKYKIFKNLLGSKTKDSNSSQKSDKQVTKISPTHVRSQRHNERDQQISYKHREHEYSSGREDHEYLNQRKGSSTDSGRVSPESSRHNSSVSSRHNSSVGSVQTDGECDIGHVLTSIKVVSTETVKTTQTRLYAMPRSSYNWRYLVDKILELQSKNQKLIFDNSEMRRTFNSVKFDSDRLSQFEKRNLDLQLENKKLNKIIEMMQGGYQYKNPHDDKEYHYFTAC